MCAADLRAHSSRCPERCMRCRRMPAAAAVETVAKAATVAAAAAWRRDQDWRQRGSKYSGHWNSRSSRPRDRQIADHRCTCVADLRAHSSRYRGMYTRCRRKQGWRLRLRLTPNKWHASPPPATSACMLSATAYCLVNYAQCLTSSDTCISQVENRSAGWVSPRSPNLRKRKQLATRSPRAPRAPLESSKSSNTQ